MVVGVVEAVMFLGRQVARADTGVRRLVGVGGDVAGGAGGDRPGHGLGRLLPRRPAAVASLAPGRRRRGRARGVRRRCCSAGWPAGYETSGVESAHPFHSTTGGRSRLWDWVAYPSFVGLPAAVGRGARRPLADRRPARQLGLAAGRRLGLGHRPGGGAGRRGLARGRGCSPPARSRSPPGWRSCTASTRGVLRADLALRSGGDPRELPAGLARAAAEALHATESVGLARRPRSGLHAVGLWPRPARTRQPAAWRALAGTMVRHVPPRRGAVVGALARRRADPLSRAEERLLDDLARQAALVLDHLTSTETIARERRAGHLDGLTPREQEVLGADLPRPLERRHLRGAAPQRQDRRAGRRQHLHQARAARRLRQQPAGAGGPGVRAGRADLDASAATWPGSTTRRRRRIGSGVVRRRSRLSSPRA